jgi:hypothetical protein
VFQVKLKVRDLLVQNSRAGSTGLEVFSVSANEGENLLELLRRLADQNEALTNIASYVLRQDADMPSVIILG